MEPKFESDNHYEVLGIQKTASDNEIKKAYHKLAIIWHPDKNKNPKATDIFKRIAEAYETLSDKTRREEYDR